MWKQPGVRVDRASFGLNRLQDRSGRCGCKVCEESGRRECIRVGVDFFAECMRSKQNVVRRKAAVDSFGMVMQRLNCVFNNGKPLRHLEDTIERRFWRPFRDRRTIKSLPLGCSRAVGACLSLLI